MGSQMQRASDDALINNTLKAIAGFITQPYDYIDVSYPDTVTETYHYKLGGVSGATVGIVTVVYTDATKDYLDYVDVT